MQLVWTVNVWDLLVLALGGVALYVTLTNRLAVLETKMDPVYRWYTATPRPMGFFQSGQPIMQAQVKESPSA